jgi:hypothetical protein
VVSLNAAVAGVLSAQDECESLSTFARMDPNTQSRPYSTDLCQSAVQLISVSGFRREEPAPEVIFKGVGTTEVPDHRPRGAVA